MNASQHNTLAMGQAVSTSLETITAATALPALRVRHAVLKNYIEYIKSHAAIQALPTTGRTVDRDALIATVADAALAVAGMVSSYAAVNQLGDLAAKVRLNPSQFTLGRLVRRLQLAQQVHDAATAELPHLGDYGVTATVLADLQAKIDVATPVLGSPRLAIMTRRVATENLARAFRELRGLLNDEIDPLITSLRRVDPDGYALYQAARTVIAHPGRPAVDPVATPPVTSDTPNVAPNSSTAIASPSLTTPGDTYDAFLYTDSTSVPPVDRSLNFTRYRN